MNQSDDWPELELNLPMVPEEITLWALSLPGDFTTVFSHYNDLLCEMYGHHRASEISSFVSTEIFVWARHLGKNYPHMIRAYEAGYNNRYACVQVAGIAAIHIHVSLIDSYIGKIKHDVR